MIQIRNVPDRIHRALKVRAAREGVSLSDYLLSELEDLTARPTPVEMRDRLEAREAVHGGESSVDVVRAVREARDAR
jgi:plasmid stability protein